MRRDQVFKYGPLSPAFRPDDSGVIKYGPPKPAEPPGQGNKEMASLLKQITKCLKETEKILEKAETATVADELGRCLAELTLLYLRLKDLQKPGGNNRIIEYTPGQEGRDFLIVYIVTTPAATVDELLERFKK